MFDAFPERDRLGAWKSFDAVREHDVRLAISDAFAKHDHAKRLYKRAVEGAGDPSIAQSVAEHETQREQRAANIALIQAILLTAIHLEGAVNAWGVILLGEAFFKQHLERWPIESKVAILLALEGRGGIPSDHRVLVDLRSVFERRNRLAHRKTSEVRFPLNPAPFKESAPESDLEACGNALDSFRSLLVATSPRTAFLAGGYGGDPATDDP